MNVRQDMKSVKWLAAKVDDYIRYWVNLVFILPFAIGLTPSFTLLFFLSGLMVG